MLYNGSVSGSVLTHAKCYSSLSEELFLGGCSKADLTCNASTTLKIKSVPRKLRYLDA